MTDVVRDLRTLTNAGPDDYSVAGATFWTDDQLQTVLDRYRTELVRELLQSVQEYDSSGSVYYKRYICPAQNFEATTGGTAVFFLQSSTHAVMGTANYSVDYRRGLVTFTTDTAGSAYYVTGNSYDLNAAAADVWRAKAAYYALAYDFSTDSHNMRRSQMYDHCVKMAERYEAQGGPRAVFVERGDC